MRVLRSLTFPKEPDYPDANDDFFFWTTEGIACAMSDGASESFDSRTWGRLLCQVFTQTFSQAPTPALNDATIRSILAQARKMFLAVVAQRKLSWSQQAAFDRGNFASILGLVDAGPEVLILGIGDTVALWRDPKGRVQSHVLQTPDEFKKHPVLLSSDARGDSVVFERERSRWSIRRLAKSDVLSQRIFLMTDALGCYALELALGGEWQQCETAFQLPEDDFRYWVTQSRLQGKMRKDDTTLAVLDLK
jgi:hypothetical protein